MAMAMIKDIRACQDYGIATVCAADGADGRWLAERFTSTAFSCAASQKASGFVTGAGWIAGR
jgi:hypothetical protein